MYTFTFDNTSLFLLGATIALAFYLRSSLSTPSPLVHPLLLAKQSEPSQTRQKNQSAIYRNWGTGFGVPLPTQPSGNVKIVSDLVETNPEGLDSKRGRQMYQGMKKVFEGILSDEEDNLIAYIPTEKKVESAPEDNAKSVVELTCLHLATSLSPSLQLLYLPSIDQIPTALSSKHHSPPKIFFIRYPQLESLLSVLAKKGSKSSKPRYGIILADVPLLKSPTLPSPSGIVISSYWDVLDAGDRQLTILEEELNLREGGGEERRSRIEAYTKILGKDKTAGARGDVLRVVVDGKRCEVEDVHAITYTADGDVLKVTNENITAGLSSLLSLFPASLRPTPSLPSTTTKDKKPAFPKKFEDVYLISEDLSTPLGMTLLLMGCLTTQSISQGNQVKLITPEQSDDPRTWLQTGATKWSNIKPTTLAFIDRLRLQQLTTFTTQNAQNSLLYTLARRSKLAGLQAGYLDRMDWLTQWVWKGAWMKNGGVGSGLRGVVCIGEAPSQSLVLESNIQLSIPMCRAFTSPNSTSPIFASHLHDFQQLNSDASKEAHVGPPTSNMEVMLMGEGVEQVEVGGDPEGQVRVRSPAVVERCGKTSEEDGWVELGRAASVRSNGTFRV